jgi:hypothetical protein
MNSLHSSTERKRGCPHSSHMDSSNLASLIRKGVAWTTDIPFEPFLTRSQIRVL